MSTAIDPRFVGVETGQLWEIINRTITKEWQQFGLRPVDETESPRVCNGCGERPATAILTVFAPGEFDQVAGPSSEAVTVTARPGFYRASDGMRDAVLAWSYAENAWATVEGRTLTASDRSRMIALGSALRVADRNPVRSPFRLETLPANMPLQAIVTQHGRYPTILTFGGCPMDGHNLTAQACSSDAPSLTVQLWPRDDYPSSSFEIAGGTRETYIVPVGIGGRTGYLDGTKNAAAIRVRSGLVVTFSFSGSQGPIRTDLVDILKNVQWAENIDDEDSWPAVAEWTR